MKPYPIVKSHIDFIEKWLTSAALTMTLLLPELIKMLFNDDHKSRGDAKLVAVILNRCAVPFSVLLLNLRDNLRKGHAVDERALHLV